MRMDVPEVVGGTHGEPVGVEGVVIEEAGPELVFVVAAYRHVAPYPILDPAAWGIDGSAVVGVCGSDMLEIDATISQQKLDVWMKVAVVARGYKSPRPRQCPDAVSGQYRYGHS
jgi:hypothetical protein